MYNIKDIAKKLLLTQKFGLSVFSGIDLALSSKQKIAFEVSINEYIELSSACGLILNNPNILVLPGDYGLGALDGFISITDKLTDKLSYVLSSGLKDVFVIVFIKGVDLYKYYDIIKTEKLDLNIDYNMVVNKLNLVGYERVVSIDSPNQYCVKGGVIDVFSPLYANPIRVCLYDDVPSLRFFNLSSGLMLKGAIKEFVLIKKKKKERHITIQRLLQKTKIKKYTGVLGKQKKTQSSFVPILYSDFIKQNKEKQYLDSLYFSAYLYNGIILAPVSYKKQSVVALPQEDVSLEKGDYVCHEDFGVGVLVGFVGGDGENSQEFLKIKYKDATVRLSVDNLNKLTFVSRELSNNIKTHALSKRGLWKKQKARSKELVCESVEQLVSFYKNKQNVYRRPYVCDQALELPFLGAFKYQDTKGQALAWKEISQDLEKERPMYRLLCGDVGFGKTEISMRAAFRVVINGGRVLLLAPTSVLVAQHRRVFGDRFKSFPINIRSYSSSLSLSDRVKIKNSWVRGDIDILIGTSALLYDDVFIEFASIFIIDEEHRFGVKDKEGVLDRFINKDVLLLSATPIPRSLNLSLSGLSDISILSSPPVLRSPIQTFVGYLNDLLIKRAIDFELSRSGQVFFVHNNIDSIRSIKSYLMRLCPNIQVLVAHSKVPPKELKGRLLSFVNHKADLLLCTSIIGSGIDIPNANTIIINGAHRFGLGQLHQIRGRVGRSVRQGFAYLLLPQGFGLTINAKKRLKSIEKNVSLGSGYNIAKSDLQIRGGGVLFGYQQSGRSFDFGFEFYSKLLSKTVSSVLGESVYSFVDNFVYSVDFVCSFSSSYIKNSFDRLRFYRLLGGYYDKAKVAVFRAHLKDLYGPLPLGATNLIHMRLVSILCFYLKITSLVCKLGKVTLSFSPSFKGGDFLLSFLVVCKDVFGLESHVFRVTDNATVLCLCFNKKKSLDGLFLLDFLKKMKGGYVKK